MKHILNQNSKFLLLLVINVFVSCEFTPKGGGDLLFSKSISNSKELSVFISEYQPIVPYFEYKDSIVNIKIYFNEAFIEYSHKEKSRIPAYNPPQYTIFNSNQFVSYIDLDKSILNGMDSLWRVGNSNFSITSSTIRFRHLTNEDTIKVPITSSYVYEEKIGMESGQEVVFGEIKFVRKKE